MHFDTLSSNGIFAMYVKHMVYSNVIAFIFTSWSLRRHERKVAVNV